ncbi:MAG: CDP-glycerol glycerophosphotransferase family protein [Actinomycetota bacterium]
MTARSIVFQGYAPVHALCFLPVAKRLASDDVELWFTGGYKRGHRPRRTYLDGEEMFGRLGVPAERVLDVESASGRRFDVLVSAATHPIVPFEQCETTVQVFHGISMRNRGVRRENLAYDHLWIVGPFMHALFDRLGLLPTNDPRGVPIGFPKTDPLLNGSLDRDDTLRRLGVSGDRPVVLYAPTGAEGNSMEIHGREIVSAISRSGCADLLVKYHDHPRNPGRGPSMNELAVLDHVHVVDDVDVVPLLHAADALITDASSVANEFLLLDRPILFMDVPEVFEVAAQKGAFVDFDSRSTGRIVSTPDDVVDALAEVLARPEVGGQERRRRVAELYYNPGTATDAAADWFRRELLT